MAVPSNPTVSGICTKGLNRGGQYNATAAQITLASEEFLQEIKSDIMRVAPNHSHLETTATAPTVKGQARYAIPADHHRSLALLLLDADDANRGTAQAGASSTITLDADYTANEDDVIGKWIFTTGGTGSGQYRQITGYNNSTKVVTPDTAWTTTPDSTTTYLICFYHRPLWDEHHIERHDTRLVPGTLGTPLRASLYNQEFYLWPVPDKSTYGLVHRYTVDLSKLDEAGTLFIQLLREWRSLWIQGIAAYTMQRYDDERFPQTWELYQQQLAALSREARQYAQVEAHR